MASVRSVSVNITVYYRNGCWNGQCFDDKGNAIPGCGVTNISDKEYAELRSLYRDIATHWPCGYDDAMEQEVKSYGADLEKTGYKPEIKDLMDAPVLVKYYDPCGLGTWLVVGSQRDGDTWILHKTFMAGVRVTSSLAI